MEQDICVLSKEEENYFNAFFYFLHNQGFNDSEHCYKYDDEYSSYYSLNDGKKQICIVAKKEDGKSIIYKYECSDVNENTHMGISKTDMSMGSNGANWWISKNSSKANELTTWNLYKDNIKKYFINDSNSINVKYDPVLSCINGTNHSSENNEIQAIKNTFDIYNLNNIKQEKEKYYIRVIVVINASLGSGRGKEFICEFIYEKDKSKKDLNSRNVKSFNWKYVYYYLNEEELKINDQSKEAQIITETKNEIKKIKKEISEKINVSSGTLSDVKSNLVTYTTESASSVDKDNLVTGTEELDRYYIREYKILKILLYPTKEPYYDIIYNNYRIYVAGKYNMDNNNPKFEEVYCPICGEIIDNKNKITIDTHFKKIENSLSICSYCSRNIYKLVCSKDIESIEDSKTTIQYCKHCYKPEIQYAKGLKTDGTLDSALTNKLKIDINSYSLNDNDMVKCEQCGDAFVSENNQKLCNLCTKMKNLIESTDNKEHKDIEDINEGKKIYKKYKKLITLWKRLINFKNKFAVEDSNRIIICLGKKLYFYDMSKTNISNKKIKEDKTRDIVLNKKEEEL